MGGPQVLTIPARRGQGICNPECSGSDVCQGGRCVPLYDWEELTRCAKQIKREFPDERQVIITADPVIEYEHLIGAMDALRSDGTDPLFPQVLIGGAIR